MSLDATVGGANSNSYAVVATADAYFANRFVSTAWDALTTTQKEKALVTATRQIETLKYKSEKASTAIVGHADYQALAFPRDYHYNESGAIYIASEVIEALCEQAYFVIGYQDEAEKRRALQAQGVKSFSTGGVENFNAPSVTENYVDGGAAASESICVNARRLLAPHIDHSFCVLRA